MTMNEKWIWCTAPGCARQAETCDADHAIPFDHADPAAGGRTDLENLLPLCRAHHLMKTEGTLTLRTGPGGLTLLSREIAMVRGIVPRNLRELRPVAGATGAGATGAVAQRPCGMAMPSRSSAWSSCSSVRSPFSTWPRSMTTWRTVFFSARDCLATLEAAS